MSGRDGSGAEGDGHRGDAHGCVADVDHETKGEVTQARPTDRSSHDLSGPNVFP